MFKKTALFLQLGFPYSFGYFGLCVTSNIVDKQQQQAKIKKDEASKGTESAENKGLETASDRRENKK